MCPGKQSLACCPMLVLLSDPQLQELGLQLHPGNVALQNNDNEYSIFEAAIYLTICSLPVP